ncbi:rod shape-determining protein RodA [Paenibacillus sp. P25]|nr:rod shape-determining protein RodA [Paenibacillus sp. P25]
MLRKFQKVDWSIVVILILFMVISTLLVYSATINGTELKFDAKKLTIIYVISIIGFLAATTIDYRILTKFSYYLYGAGLILLVAVLKFGVEKGGATGWFSLPFGLDFQPVELFKIILILTVSYFIGKLKGEPMTFLRGIVPVGVLTLVPIALVMAQPDFGNAIILVAVLIGLYWIGQVPITYVLSGIAAISAFGYFFLHYFKLYYTQIKEYLIAHKLPFHWMARINTFIDPESATNDQKYQVVNSVRAIGSGSLTGEGFLHGTSIHNNFIPVAYSDSIFVVIGEEFGFIGASILLLLYFVLIYRMILIAIYTNNFAGRYIVVGVISMLVFQIFENIGMMIGIMPLTGITLPFVSYGGTSLMINMIAMGLVMSIKIHDDLLLDEDL